MATTLDTLIENQREIVRGGQRLIADALNSEKPWLDRDFALALATHIDKLETLEGQRDYETNRNAVSELDLDGLKKVIEGSECNAYAQVFVNGKPVSQTIHWRVDR